MMSKRLFMKMVPPRGKALIVVFGAGWTVLLLAGGLPAVSRSHRNQARIEETDARLATLNQWLVAGAWLQEGVRRWEPALRDDYARLFPVEKGREDLYLDLARVARQSGIDPIGIREAPQTFLPGTDQWEEAEEWEEGQSDDTALLVDRFAPDLSHLPGRRLVAHRLLVEFAAGYEQIAGFLAGLESIPRAVSVHTLQCEPSTDGIEARMELDFYVQQQD